MLLHGMTQNRVGEVFRSVAGVLTRGSKTLGAGGTPTTRCRLANAACTGWGAQSLFCLFFWTGFFHFFWMAQFTCLGVEIEKKNNTLRHKKNFSTLFFVVSLFLKSAEFRPMWYCIILLILTSRDYINHLEHRPRYRYVCFPLMQIEIKA